MSANYNVKIKRPILWIAGSAFAAVLSMGGFALTRNNCKQNEAGFLLLVIAGTALWLSSVTLLVSLLCWMASGIFPSRKLQFL